MSQIFHLRDDQRGYQAGILFILIMGPFFFCCHGFADQEPSHEYADKSFVIYETAEHVLRESEIEHLCTAESLQNHKVTVLVEHTASDKIVKILSLQNGQISLLNEFKTTPFTDLKAEISFFSIKGEKSPVQIIHITETAQGTAALTTEHVYEVFWHDNLKLRPVHFVPAAKAYVPYLKPGEEIRQGTKTWFLADGLFFEFFVWNEEDANCCPTAGKVSGTYRLVREEGEAGQLFMTMDTYHRTSVQD